MTRPESDEILKSFYRTVRPWAFWDPIYRLRRAEDAEILPNQGFWRDLFNLTIGLVW
jgi:solute:Na+ symporter, SSS family